MISTALTMPELPTSFIATKSESSSVPKQGNLYARPRTHRLPALNERALPPPL